MPTGAPQADDRDAAPAEDRAADARVADDRAGAGDSLAGAEPIATIDEPWTALAAWAADELGLRVAADGGVYRIEPNPAAAEEGDAEPSDSAVRRGWFGLRVARPDESAAEDAPPPFATTHPADVVAELATRLGALPAPPSVHPTDQPEAVHDLAARLFEAYRLDGGQAHLAGFHLEDVPLLRLTTLAATDDDSARVTHRYFDELGTPLSAERIAALGAERTTAWRDRPPRLDAGRLARMLESARRTAGLTSEAPEPGPSEPGSSEPDSSDEPTLASLVWVKRAWGRLRFEFDDASVDTPFEGWARTLRAPAVVCPETGVQTFHLATTEDGRIAAADQIAVCEATGHRHVRAELERCATTSKLVEPTLLSACPVTGDRSLAEAFAPCRLCDQRVSRGASPEGVCAACREKSRIGADDPRVAALVAKHPGLARWGHWRLAETRDVLIVEASRRLKCVQWVFRRSDLKCIHAVATLRLASTWRPLSREQRERLLG